MTNVARMIAAGEARGERVHLDSDLCLELGGEGRTLGRGHLEEGQQRIERSAVAW